MLDAVFRGSLQRSCPLIVPTNAVGVVTMFSLAPVDPVVVLTNGWQRNKFPFKAKETERTFSDNLGVVIHFKGFDRVITGIRVVPDHLPALGQVGSDLGNRTREPHVIQRHQTPLPFSKSNSGSVDNQTVAPNGFNMPIGSSPPTPGLPALRQMFP